MSNEMDKFFGWGVAAVIIATIIGALMMVGGPSKARDEKIDAKRLSNMQETARVISCYAGNENDVPKTSELAKTALGERNILPQGGTNGRRDCLRLKWETDPVTKEEFEFRRLDKSSFELCAVFLREGNNLTGSGYYGYSVNDEVLYTGKPRARAGRHCYTAKNWRHG